MLDDEECCVCSISFLELLRREGRVVWDDFIYKVVATGGEMTDLGSSEESTTLVLFQNLDQATT